MRLWARRAAQWSAGPVAAGIVIALAVLAGVDVTGPVGWLTTGLSLIPAALVHCQNRDRDFTWAETCAISLAAAVVAYGVMVIGLITGATVTFAVYIAAKTGSLAALVQIGTLATLIDTALTRRKPA